jgi:F-type H+-transporting ATPase subunit gamma
MGAQLREVRRRIGAVQSTAKITRAQELIASSRIIKAQQRVRAAQPYARELTRAVEAVVSGSPTLNHPLVTEPQDPKRAAVVMLTSDRGFAGGYNANVLREAQSLIATLTERGIEAVPYVSGTKGIVWHRFRDKDMAAEWSGYSERPEFSDASRIAERLIEDFGAGEGEGAGIDEIHLVSTEFVSMLTQRPIVRRILPLEIEETTEEPPEGRLNIYEFEPSPEGVLDALLPWYVETRLYQALLDAAAAEVAARRRAMKSATDNAKDLIEVLTREANKARQAEITQEISEIVGGANALAEENAGSE